MKRMAQKSSSQIQVRIDSQTKREVREILDTMGLDLSTVVKMLCKQIQRSGSLPFEVRDVNGFRPEKARELRAAIREAHSPNAKRYRSVRALMKDLGK